MRIFLLLTTFFVIGCKKNDIGNTSRDMTGYLDSIAVSLTDSADFSDKFTFIRFSYDQNGRVTQENMESLFRLFNYSGDNNLPYQQVDSSSSSSSGQSSVTQHNFSFDNQSRVVSDNVFRYTRYFTINDSTLLDHYVLSYRYENNYMIRNKSSNTICMDSDTTFFNSTGDIERKHYVCYNDEVFQKADEYYNVLNPLGELNIAPLFASNSLYWFDIETHPIQYPMTQPKYFYKTISGTNTIYNSHHDDDIVRVSFYLTNNASGKVSQAILSQYTYFNDFSGNPVYDKYFVNYQFYYR